MIKYFTRLLLFLTVSCSFSLIGQNQVGINTNTPDASSILHIESANRGLLIPRMTSVNRRAISSPAEGLMVFDTDTDTFWYSSGGGWTEIISNNQIPDGLGDTDSDTRIFLEFGIDNEQARFYQTGTEFMRMRGRRLEYRNTGSSVFIGDSAGANDDKVTNLNVFIGTRSGQFNDGGRRNVAIGYQSLQSNASENDNIAIGSMAANGAASVRRSIAIGTNTLQINSAEDFHVAIGHGIMPIQATGNNNLAMGNGALASSTAARSSTAVGVSAMGNNVSGVANVAIGTNAGLNSSSSSIYVGHQAGRQEISGGRLYIDNSNTTSPLIWGNFFSNTIQVNGNLHISTDLTYVGTITDVSDRRLKENIQQLEKVLPRLLKLQAFRYNLKEDQNKQKEIGLIAQDVKKVFPHACRVINNENKYLGVSYIQLLPITVQAINEQHAKINRASENTIKLDAEIDQLAREIENLKVILKKKSTSEELRANIY